MVAVGGGSGDGDGAGRKQYITVMHSILSSKWLQNSRRKNRLENCSCGNSVNIICTFSQV